jgi:hypothetical protein
MFTKQVKPLRRTPKGTIQRRKNYELYQEEIDELYAKYTLALLTKDRKALLEKMLHLFSNSFHKCYSAILEVETIKSNEDLFTLGMDSLKVFVCIASDIANAIYGKINWL